jgi:hypothetical protein
MKDEKRDLQAVSRNWKSGNAASLINWMHMVMMTLGKWNITELLLSETSTLSFKLLLQTWKGKYRLVLMKLLADVIQPEGAILHSEMQYLITSIWNKE